MKMCALLLICLMAPATPAHAQWRVEHTMLAVTSSAAIAGDWLLTTDAVRHSEYQELNPVLGAHPSIGWLATYNVLALGANLAIGRLLPAGARSLWFAAVTGFESAIVLHQFNVGLRVNLSNLK
jgi:hypothetical protein